MARYVGMDVSLEETPICVVDDSGEIVSEGTGISEPSAMAAFVKAALWLQINQGDRNDAVIRQRPPTPSYGGQEPRLRERTVNPAGTSRRELDIRPPSSRTAWTRSGHAKDIACDVTVEMTPIHDPENPHAQEAGPPIELRP
jgi:hypothetical protein